MELRPNHILRAIEEVDKEHRHTKLSCGFDGSQLVTLDSAHDIARDYVSKLAYSLVHQLETDGLEPNKHDPSCACSKCRGIDSDEDAVKTKKRKRKSARRI